MPPAEVVDEINKKVDMTKLENTLMDEGLTFITFSLRILLAIARLAAEAQTKRTTRPEGRGVRRMISLLPAPFDLGAGGDDEDPGAVAHHHAPNRDVRLLTIELDLSLLLVDPVPQLAVRRPSGRE